MTQILLRTIPELAPSPEQVADIFMGRFHRETPIEVLIPSVEDLLEKLMPNYENFLCPLTFKEKGIRTYEYEGKFFVYEFMDFEKDRREFASADELFKFVLTLFRRFLSKEFKMAFNNFSLSLFYTKWIFSDELVLKLLEQSIRTSGPVVYRPSIKLPPIEDVIRILLDKEKNILSKDNDISDGIHIVKQGPEYLRQFFERGQILFEERFATFEEALITHVKTILETKYEYRKIFSGLNHLEFSQNA